MKAKFGSFLSRIMRGGSTLNPLEQQLLELGLKRLPLEIQSPLQKQINSYNLVQREVDGRALNFYMIKRGRPGHDGLPELPVKNGDVPLLRISVELKGLEAPLHFTLNAVERWFFCVSFSRDTRPLAKKEIVSVSKVVEAWRSNILIAQPSAQADSPAAGGPAA